MKNKICVLGSYVCQMSACLPHVPQPGETIVANDFDMGQGGKGNNVAIAIKRLGADVVLIERVGDDIFGEMAFEVYKDEGIDTSYVKKTSTVQSGVGLVYVQPNGENTAAYFPGANENLCAEDVYAAEEDIKDAEIMYLQLEIPDEAILAGVELAKKYGMKIILNPAPARKIPSGLIEKVDLLTPNLGEAFTLTNRGFREGLTMEEVEELAKALLQSGPSEVVITLGGKGAYYINQLGKSHYKAAFPVQVVDTVGAGDSFNAGLCVAIAEGLSIEDSMTNACICGALTTTKLGVIEALPSINQVSEYIKDLHKEDGGLA